MREHQHPTSDAAPPIAPGLLAGIGFGAFVDGILFHQILQWHHFVSSTSGGTGSSPDVLEHNMVWDGIFHVVAWTVAAAALYVSWNAWRAGRIAPPWRVHIGLALAGWGAFNLVDAVVFHYVLAIHHLRDDVDDGAIWDLGYLAVGFALLLGGLALARAGEREFHRELDERRTRASVPEPGARR